MANNLCSLRHRRQTDTTAMAQRPEPGCWKALCAAQSQRKPLRATAGIANPVLRTRQTKTQPRGAPVYLGAPGRIQTFERLVRSSRLGAQQIGPVACFSGRRVAILSIMHDHATLTPAKLRRYVYQERECHRYSVKRPTGFSPTYETERHRSGSRRKIDPALKTIGVMYLSPRPARSPATTRARANRAPRPGIRLCCIFSRSAQGYLAESPASTPPCDSTRQCDPASTRDE